MLLGCVSLAINAVNVELSMQQLLRSTHSAREVGEVLGIMLTCSAVAQYLAQSPQVGATSNISAAIDII